MDSLVSAIRAFLAKNRKVRNFVRWARWQSKKIPGLRVASVAFDSWFFSREGSERPDFDDPAEPNDYFEGYARVLERQVRGVVLDVGCGHGYLTRRMAQNPKVLKIVALDKIADFRCMDPKIEYQTADIVSRENFGGPFDVIVSSEFIEHIAEKDFRDLMPRLLRSLKNDGIFIGSTPINPTPYPTCSGSRYHVREYSMRDLGDILRGFFLEVQIVKVSEYCQVWKCGKKK